jgi:HAD superfamily phosphoserine phosphatase-like hydrolase
MKLSMAIELVAFDLDGTLIRGETCVEAIARRIGRSRECAAFEALSMRDTHAVTAARETIAGWYRGYTDSELTVGLSDMVLAPGSEEAFDLLRANGIKTAIVSLTWSVAVEWFAEKLRADHALGTRHSPVGIEHVWPADKGRWLEDLSGKLGLHRDQVAAVGDSDSDRELLEAAGSRFFVGEDAPPIPQLIHLPAADMSDIASRIVATD